MCDYSLFSIRNRLATEGEKLTVQRFETGSVGLATPSDPSTAVCIPPGSQLLVQDIPERLQIKLGIGPCEPGVFFERTAQIYEYRDAVRFNNCRDILVQHLAEGQRITVVSLGAAESLNDRSQPTAYRHTRVECVPV